MLAANVRGKMVRQGEGTNFTKVIDNDVISSTIFIGGLGYELIDMKGATTQ